MNLIRRLSLSIPYRMYSRGNRFTERNYERNNEYYSDDDFDDFDNEPNKYRTDEYSNKFTKKNYFTQPHENYRPYQQFNNNNHNRQFNALSNQEISHKIQLNPIVQQKMLKYREFTDQKLEEIYATDSVEKAVSLLDIYRRHIESTLSKQSNENVNELKHLDDSVTQDCVQSQNNSNDSGSPSLDDDGKSLKYENEESTFASNDEIAPITTNLNIKEPSYVEEIVLQEKEEVPTEIQRSV